MTSLFDENRCKLLVLDLDPQRISVQDLNVYFNHYAPTKMIEYPSHSRSALIYFHSYEMVDYLIYFNRCSINDQSVRLRRYRSDRSNCHLDSSTLHVKSSATDYPLDEESLRQCFHHYQSVIQSIELISHSQALMTFQSYDHVDQILLMPSEMFNIHDQPVQLERILSKRKARSSRWDQSSDVKSLSVRNPLMYKLISHIEYLTKQLRDQPMSSQQEIARLEKEISALKNENAQLKAEKRRSAFALKDISNRRERSPAEEKLIKRHRACPLSFNNYEH